MYIQVCEHFTNIAKGGGQNKKLTKNRGRPTGETSKELLHHIDSIAPASLFSVDVYKLEYHTPSLSDQLSCPICTAVLDQPVELSCGAIVCFHCCSNWVMHCTSARLPTPCPCCYDHPLDSTTVRPPPQLIILCSQTCFLAARESVVTKLEQISMRNIFRVGAKATISTQHTHHLK